MRDILDQIEAEIIELKYERDRMFSKFLKVHGDKYTQEELIKFLRERYEYINKINGPDHS